MLLFEGKLITEEDFNQETERLKEINHKVVKKAYKWLKENKSVEEIFSMTDEEKDRILDKFRGGLNPLKNRPILYEGKLINEKEYAEKVGFESLKNFLNIVKEEITDQQYNNAINSFRITKDNNIYDCDFDF